MTESFAELFERSQTLAKLKPGTIVTGTVVEVRTDVVVVNAHPILAVAETSLAGRAADAIVLTAEKYESSLPLVTRAQEKVAALAPEAFGVVVLGASRDECLQ